MAAADGALTATLPGPDAALVVSGLAVAAPEHPVCTVRMAASSGHRGIGVFVGDRVVRAVPFRLLPDGEPHTYLLRCAAWGPCDRARSLTAAGTWGPSREALRVPGPVLPVARSQREGDRFLITMSWVGRPSSARPGSARADMRGALTANV